MCEPLRGKIKKVDDWDEGGGWIIIDDEEIHDSGIVRDYKKQFDILYKKDVKSAVEFYKRYKDNPAKLAKEQPEHYAKFYEGLECNHKMSFVEYCFGDVIDD